MTAEHMFFSQAWCDGALETAHATDDIYKNLKDPDSFTVVLAFECTDREGPETHLEYEAGREKSWTLGTFPEEQIFARFRATTDTWHQAAEGEKTGAQLLMGGKIKLVKGPMVTAVENANAFNALVASWGGVPTDWQR